ncbi:unnamed protein product [Ambrosiozyma monospora]|uniref:Unnamed protein product n=1 Tax=Ambrosiozyma monospora TaxID=43982 RepID=A0A9W7DHS4_AMBMO|nr:unnamed protein product [Ambrosiozyma monospora]
MALPLAYDSALKKVSLDEDVSLSENKALNLEISQLNTLAKELLNTNSEIPPPPAKEFFTKNLSMMVRKMHESGVNSMRTSKFPEAAKQFTVALGLATARPKFESFQMTIPETLLCIIGRCDANLKNENYMDAYLDAEILATLGPNIPDNHFRKGMALLHLRQLQAAKTSFETALTFGPSNPVILREINKELEHVKHLIAEENGEDDD